MRLFYLCFICMTIICVSQLPVSTVAQQVSGTQTKYPLTNQDVVLMVLAKLDDTTIVKMIQAGSEL